MNANVALPVIIGIQVQVVCKTVQVRIKIIVYAITVTIHKARKGCIDKIRDPIRVSITRGVSATTFKCIQDPVIIIIDIYIVINPVTSSL